MEYLTGIVMGIFLTLCIVSIITIRDYTQSYYSEYDDDIYDNDDEDEDEFYDKE